MRFLKTLIKGLLTIVVLVVVVVVGINLWVIGSARPYIATTIQMGEFVENGGVAGQDGSVMDREAASSEANSTLERVGGAVSDAVDTAGALVGADDGSKVLGVTYDCIIVLGASVQPDGTPSAILRNRIEAAVSLYERGIAPVIIMSGDGRESNYDEPSAMKDYAVSLGVPADAVYCDPGGYHTYDTMWRVAHVYGAQSALVVTQEYHLYRAVYDARGVGLEAAGVVSDEGTYDDQDWYDIRECAGRLQDFELVMRKAVPDNPYAEITL